MDAPSGPNAENAELRVLVVDDDVDAATSLSYLLQVLNCRTAVAFDGAMALRVAQLFQPTLVFLDLEMPGGDGCRVLQELRLQDGDARRTYYVCLTGRSDPADEHRCLEAGFDRFITKPMDPATLSEILSTGCNGGLAVTVNRMAGGTASS